MRDRRLCRLDIAVRYRVLHLRPDAWSSGLASFRMLSPRDAGHVHRDTCLWNAVKQPASRLHELGRPRIATERVVHPTSAYPPTAAAWRTFRHFGFVP